MKKHTYWTVKVFVNGLGAVDYYYHSYENAKKESEKDYRDKPVKHTVNTNTYERLCYSWVFEDEEV